MKALLYLGVLFCALFTTAQESIESWQKKHPDVLFFQEDIYNSLSVEQQTQIGNKVVLYTQEITLKDIQQFELNNVNAVKSTSISIEEVNSDEIKHWLTSNRDIKIITQTYYSALTSAEQLIYKQNGALILTGDIITLNDIENYAAIY